MRKMETWKKVKIRIWTFFFFDFFGCEQRLNAEPDILKMHNRNDSRRNLRAEYAKIWCEGERTNLAKKILYFFLFEPKEKGGKFWPLRLLVSRKKILYILRYRVLVSSTDSSVSSALIGLPRLPFFFLISIFDLMLCFCCENHFWSFEELKEYTIALNNPWVGMKNRTP